MLREIECEFLIKLAPVWFACRWRLFGGQLRKQDEWPKAEAQNDLLGCRDYAAEMRPVCREMRAQVLLNA